MNDMETKYTSTGQKLFYHPDVVKKVKDTHRAEVVSISVAPTSRCNLRCSFCSNVNRKSHEDLDFDKLCILLCKLKACGLKTVEFSGGGEPSLYKYINELIRYAAELELEIGYITNGILLQDKVVQENLDALKWVRVSMNALDYITPGSLILPKIKGTLGFSYVINEDTKTESIALLNEYVKEYNPSYVRIVPNCLATNEEQIRNNRKYSEIVREWGYPFFYQAKVFETPKRCWWGYFKPFLLHDGYIYRCSSVVLNDNAGRGFHPDYRWVYMDEAPELLCNSDMIPFNTERCDSCVFCRQNDMIDGLFYPSEMENFI
jgi:MoaA/NifB/PqqE/SkfB family radical SAM enzyme